MADWEAVCSAAPQSCAGLPKMRSHSLSIVSMLPVLLSSIMRFMMVLTASGMRLLSYRASNWDSLAVSRQPRRSCVSCRLRLRLRSYRSYWNIKSMHILQPDA